MPAYEVIRVFRFHQHTGARHCGEEFREEGPYLRERPAATAPDAVTEISIVRFADGRMYRLLYHTPLPKCPVLPSPTSEAVFNGQDTLLAWVQVKTKPCVIWNGQPENEPVWKTASSFDTPVVFAAEDGTFWRIDVKKPIVETLQ